LSTAQHVGIPQGSVYIRVNTDFSVFNSSSVGRRKEEKEKTI